MHYFIINCHHVFISVQLLHVKGKASLKVSSMMKNVAQNTRFDYLMYAVVYQCDISPNESHTP